MKYNRLRIVLITTFFLALIAFPLVNKKLDLFSDIKNFENRRLAQEPYFKETPIDSFPKFYEKYYNDYFPLRSRMMKSFNYFTFFILHKLPSSDFVMLGKNHWLFFTGDELDVYTGKQTFTNKQLLAFKEELEYRKRYLKSQNCKFYVMITPVKAVIYPENMPYTPRISKKSLGEELCDYLQKYSDVNVVNIYEALKANKKTYPTFYAIDNHWTRPGAFYSANQFLAQLQKDYPETTSLSLNDYQISKNDTTDGNTDKILATPGFFHDTSYRMSLREKPKAVFGIKSGYIPDKKFPYPYDYELVKTIKDSKAPRLLIISDSFGTDIFPFLSEKFSKTVKIWDNWQYKLNEEIVRHEKPDIVLLIIHEKNLRALMQHRSGLGKNNPF